MEDRNTSGNNPQRTGQAQPQDHRKDEEAGKKGQQQSQGGASQNWQSQEDEGTESGPSSGSTKQSDENRAGSQQYPGGQSSPSRQSGQSGQSNPKNNPPK